MPNQALINSIAIALLGFAATYIWRRMDRRVRETEAAKLEAVRKAEKLAIEHKELADLVSSLRYELTAVKQVAEPLNELMKRALIKELTHFHTPELDELMAKTGGRDEDGTVRPNTLTPEEDARMQVLLDERSKTLNGRISESEKEAAFILPAIIRRAKRESEAVKIVDPELKLVACVDPDVIDAVDGLTEGRRKSDGKPKSE